MARTRSKPRTRAKARPAALEERAARLAQVARLGQIFIDGDLLGRVFTEQGRAWTSGDDIDFDHDTFIELKKLVLRLESAPADGAPVYVNLWRQRPDDAGKGEVAVAGMKTSPLSVDERGRTGVVPMPRALRGAILNQRTGSESHPSGVVSVFAPLYDSLHHVAGAVEAFDDPQ